MKVFHFSQEASQGSTSEKINFHLYPKEQLESLKLIIFSNKNQTFNLILMNLTKVCRTAHLLVLQNNNHPQKRVINEELDFFLALKHPCRISENSKISDFFDYFFQTLRRLDS